ncbi:MAG: ABC transporter ATP-binding protein [Clostridia bacterium]|nr:ABC transporter ATP-binding protein [Clostridia bacterium]
MKASSDLSTVQVKGYKNLMKYMRFYLSYPWLCIGYFLGLFLQAFGSIISSLFLSVVVQNMTSGQNNAFATAFKNAGYLLAVELVILIIGVINTQFFKRLENNVMLKVKMNMVRTTLNFNLSNFERLNNGFFTTRLISDFSIISEAFKRVARTMVNIITYVGFLVFMFIQNYLLAIFIIVFIVLRYLVFKIRVHYFAKLKPGVYQSFEKGNAMITETIQGIKDLKTSQMEEKLLEKIEAQQVDYVKKDNREWYLGVTFDNLSKSVASFCDFFFILLCIYLINSNLLGFSIFYTCYIYKNKLLDFGKQLCEMANDFKITELSAKRILELNSSEFKKDKYGTKSIRGFKGNIEFKRVSFSYNEEPLLTNINMKIQPHTKIAFVGPSGCGKTTLINLMCKLYDPLKGEIYYDNVPIGELSKEFLRKNVTMITQNPYLFNMTIRENLMLASDNVTEDKIIKALKQSGIWNFVKKLPLGLDTPLGEKGTNLSGGQRQRICIARAILTGAKVFIFDEATSALDNLSQAYIMKTIDRLKKNKTIVIVAHRLTTIKDCDMIYFVDKGKIIKSGTHNFLIKKCPRYRKFYMQEEKKHKDEA